MGKHRVKNIVHRIKLHRTKEEREYLFYVIYLWRKSQLFLMYVYELNKVSVEVFLNDVTFLMMEEI